MNRLPHSTAWKHGHWQLATALILLAAATPGRAQESSPAALNVYSDAANFQNGGQYDLAAEEWEKFLKRFPEDPLAKKARHYAGVCRLQRKEYEKAAAHFQEVVKDLKFELAQDAFLNLGWCQYSLGGQGKEGMYAKAATSFAALAKQFPDGKFTDQALFYLGESQYALQKKEEAIAAYKQLADDHQESPLRCDALYALGVTHEELQQFDKAGPVYDLFLKECAESKLVTEVRMRKAETVLQAGQPAEAEKMFAAVAAVEGFAAADHALYRQAFCAARQDKFSEAGRLYARIAEDYAASSYAADAAISAGRSFYRGEDFEQALKWLQKCIDAEHPAAPEAAHWMCRILLSQGDPARAAKVAAGQVPGAAESEFLVDLKLDEADALFEVDESRAAALDKYLKIAAEHAEHRLAPQALYNAAFTALDLKRFDDGGRHAQAFLAKYAEDTLRADVQSVLGECQLHQTQYEAAEKTFREMIADHAGHAEIKQWQVRLGLILYLQQKYAETVAALTPVVGEFEDPEQLAEAHFLIGGSQFHQDQFEPAAKSLAASLAAHDKWRKSDEALLLLSRCQRGLDQFDEARATIRKMISSNPESELLDHAHYRLGEYSYAAGDLAAARQAYDVVIGKWPQSAFVPFALYGKGWAELKANDYPAGAQSFGQVIERHAGHELADDSRFGRAMCLRQTGKHAEAIADLAEFLDGDLQPDQRADALYERGQAEAGLKQFDKAAATLEAVVKDHPKYANTPGVLYELGWAYKNQDNAERAVASFARIAAQHADSEYAAEASFHVGEDQYDKEQYAEAVKSYTAARQKSQQADLSEQATHKLGWAHYRLEQFEQAGAQFDEQIKEHPDGKLLADAGFMKGECLFRQDKFAAALAAFTAARKTMPASPQMQVLLLLHGGQSAAQTEKWSESFEFLEEVPEKFPQTPLLAEALFERGRAHRQLKRLDEAVEDFEKAATISRVGVGARSRFMIGEIQFERKQHADAINTFRRVMFGFGGKNAPDDVKPWQAVAGFEAGRCAETLIPNATGDQRAKLIAAAKSYYSYVVENHAGSEYVAMAKQRLAALAKLAA